MTSAGSGDDRDDAKPSETTAPDETRAPEAALDKTRAPEPALDEAPAPAPAPTRRSPAVRVAAAVAILLILVALWILTWAVVSGALTSDDGLFGDAGAFNQPPAHTQTALLR
jgi:ferric-dicitrate binding protein FerR (iron transport regulator)